ncbi:dorsal-ventral patterning protein tolloid-like isoform X2 [Rhopilema esculentum]|uniref:dorsal-ventral patterning protein tolloid-like isoform X2 n=1 Tax=Rhopilema esculentum TaxID=499914 RepID=UPI0031DBF83E
MYSYKRRFAIIAPIALVCFITFSTMHCHILRLNCKKFANFSVKVEGKLLKGYMIVQLKGLDLHQCFGHCLHNSLCKSINFNADDSGVCQLNHITNMDVVLSFKDSWTFYTTSHSNNLVGQNCLAKDPCSQNQICMDICSCPGYQCIDCDSNTFGLTCCRKKITGESGSIKSPNYPEIYTPNAECYWTISVKPGKRIEVSFKGLEMEESTSCKLDFVRIKDGPANSTSWLTDRLCVYDDELKSIKSTGSIIHVIFESDFSIQKKGFKLDWKED